MKASILATVVILGIAALIGQRHHRQLDAARQQNSRLTTEAQALGLDHAALAATTAGDAPATRHRAPRNHAADRDAKARDFANRLAAFVMEMKQRLLDGSPPDEDFQETLFRTLDELLHLDKEQLKLLIEEMRANPALDDEERSNIIGFAIMTMANDHPAAALALLTESADLLRKDNGHILSTAISRWAQTDPAAALAWLRDYEMKHPDLDHQQARRGLIEGAARRDPTEALQLLTTLGLANDSGMISAIAEAATTPAERNATLNALRDHFKTLPQDEASNAISTALASISHQAVGDGFDAATDWIESAGLGPDETGAFIAQLQAHQTGSETGRWIEWIGDHLPPEDLGHKVEMMVAQWTRLDYQAAGEWLLKTPAGPAKSAAVKAYATTTAPHDPDTATQWALTLPPGPDRTGTLRTIHQELQRQNPDAAASFARQHGIAP